MGCQLVRRYRAARSKAIHVPEANAGMTSLSIGLGAPEFLILLLVLIPALVIWGLVKLALRISRK